MGRKQQVEWAEAQKIVLSKDLVAAAKQQLQFLAVVDRNRHLYEGHTLYKISGTNIVITCGSCGSGGGQCQSGQCGGGKCSSSCGLVAASDSWPKHRALGA